MIQNPDELKRLSPAELTELCAELRSEIITTVSEKGGHLASNLGAVELMVALYRVFDLTDDRLVLDVGHQCYAQKLLTGRLESFRHLREKGGASGFPQLSESEYDSFTAGHASTAISAALGLARARDILGGHNDVIAVVGDGALTGGMCYEALNDAGQSRTPMIVILNDNTMSISGNVGALSRYLTTLRQSKAYRGVKRGMRRGLSRIPGIGKGMFRFVEHIRDSLKDMLLDGRFFSALGFEYIGPIDGHDLKHLIRVFERVKHTDRPVLLHVVTRKGYGYTPAERDPVDFHGTMPFYVESGRMRSAPTENPCGQTIARQLCDMAKLDKRICVVTAAMTSGTGLTAFADMYPDRTFDVGIAEEHALEMAGGMAAAGLHPYVALYSTFLQRGYDQLLIDICRNRLPVTLLIDRAGLVGSDGETHQGVFDLSFLRTMPGLTIAVPRDVRELKRLVQLSRESEGPMAIRYPKTLEDMGASLEETGAISVGGWEQLSSGKDAMVLATGRTVQAALQASIELLGTDIHVGVINARFIKPMDDAMLRLAAETAPLVVTIEENVLSGGFGEGVSLRLRELGLQTDMLRLGVPDRFIAHASVAEQLKECGLDAYSIADAIRNRIGQGKQSDE